jgi:hypothetical protein
MERHWRGLPCVHSVALRAFILSPNGYRRRVIILNFISLRQDRKQKAWIKLKPKKDEKRLLGEGAVFE